MDKDKNAICVIQGGNYGSEAKGAVSLALVERDGYDWVCRTGSINAGHTVVVNGEKVAFQQLPVGAVHPHTNIVIGPGAYIHQETLDRELKRASELSGTDAAKRCYIDYNCGVHLDDYTREAKEAGRNLKIGATGKGCAEAIIHKIKDRGVGEPLLLRNHTSVRTWAWADTALLLTDAYERGERIMIEGTQGSLLDLHTGPYPYTTSRQTIASAWVSEAGLSPALNYEVILIVRSYPIRVAGDSGPMGAEISWPILARRINTRLARFNLKPLVADEAIAEFENSLSAAKRRECQRDPAVSKLVETTEALAEMSAAGRVEVGKLFETTTVTKRLRRIAELDVEQLARTVRVEQPAYIVLTFLNYQFPELTLIRELHTEARAWLRGIQETTGCWVRYCTIGPTSADLIETGLEMPKFMKLSPR